MSTESKILFSFFLFVKCTQGMSGVCDTFKSFDNRLSRHIYQSRDTPNANLPVLDMIREAGYTCVDEHKVTTEDGYILTMHRIKGGRVNGCPMTCTSCHDSGCERKPVVLLMHDFLGSSADWVMQDKDKSLGYILADSGYDVWLGNLRGNTHSREHTSLNPNKKDYWQFTFDEMAKYDMPAMISYILETTCEGDLQFVGHGMGNTVFMAMHHYFPDIHTKIRLANFLAPMAYISNMESPIHWLSKQEGTIDIFWNLFGDGELLPSNWIIDCLASLFCPHTDSGDPACGHENLCTNFLFTLTGYDCNQLNITLLDRMMHHSPAGSSSATLLHYFQEINSGGFHGYDWGSKRQNQDHHGSDEPPTYSLWDVGSPIAVYVAGEKDLLCNPKDSAKTISELPFIVPNMTHTVENPDWTHLDFVWGIEAVQYVYQDLLSNLLHCAHYSC